MDALMDALWPEDPPETARHKLHCASSALRRALNGADIAPKEAGYLLYEGGAYALNPAFPLLIDSDEFVARHEAGTRAGGAALLAEYEAACRLFTGPFLPDDLYADWSLIRREQLTRLYLTMCAALAARHLAASWYEDAADWALRILAENRCDEAAYRLLMQARARGGDRGEALRQYERCKATLDHELGVAPMPATVALFYTILRGDQLPDAGAGGA